MRTAIKETVSDMMVKPISRCAGQRRFHRRVAALDVTRDVFDHDDRIVDDESARDRERHEAERLSSENPTGTCRRGCRRATADRQQVRDYGRRQVAQKEEDHEVDQPNGEGELEFDVGDRGADCSCLVGENRHVDARGQGLRFRQQSLHRVDDGDDVGAGLPLNVEDDRGSSVRPAVSSSFGSDNRCDIGEPNCAAVFVGDDETLVVLGRLS